MPISLIDASAAPHPAIPYTIEDPIARDEADHAAEGTSDKVPTRSKWIQIDRDARQRQATADHDDDMKAIAQPAVALPKQVPQIP